jgi:hypothetical protein
LGVVAKLVNLRISNTIFSGSNTNTWKLTD